MVDFKRIARYVPDGIPEDDRPVSGDAGTDVVSSSPSTLAALSNSDGTTTLIPATAPAGMLYAEELRDVAPQSDMDALSAMQIGLARLLQGLSFWQHNLEARLAAGDLQPREFKLERIFFDFPRQEDDLDPMPSVCIRCPGDRLYGQPGLGVGILEDTADVYGEGTALRRIAHVTCELELSVWCAHKEQRRGFVSGVEKALLAEPNDDREGRRIIVADYFDRVLRCQYQRVSYGDDGMSAQSGRWMAQCFIAADIDRVVRVPLGRMQRPQFSADV